ncbi:hypothetical protein ACIBBB_35040 [Streptomyces sp. NPDC051217]|uniref:hypothetical protein n=1 Tax=Streptomyces sp. NPDC051217 TaxID=3365644 RepID=UPI00379FC8EF
MFRRREAVPFSFVAEADRFRSNIVPPPRQPIGRSELMSRTLVGLVVAAGLAGSLLFGLPSLESGQHPGQAQQSEASQGR